METTADAGRTNNGQFAPGNKAGRGNPFARQVALLRKALLDAVTPETLMAIAVKLSETALAGDLAAIKLLFSYVLGHTPKPMNPDRLDLDEAEILTSEAQAGTATIGAMQMPSASACLKVVNTARPAMDAQFSQQLVAGL